MQTVPIPAAVMPPPANAGAPAVSDSAPGSAPEGEDFGVVLARELGVEAREQRTDAAHSDAANSSSQPPQPGSEVAPPQIPPDPRLVAPALLALLPGIRTGERIAIAQTTPSDEQVFSSPREIQTAAQTAAPATEPSAQRDFALAARAHQPLPASANVADFAAPGKIPLPLAAPGKFLPPVAAPDPARVSPTGEQFTQRMPEAAVLLQVTGLAPAPVAAPATENLKLEARVGAPGWNGELAQKVVWMVTQQHQVAELHLNPPHLGPLEVILTIGNDAGAQASAQFTSPHWAVREAIEAALPRLREMLADNGIALGNVTVSADSFQQQAEAGREDRAAMKRAADQTQTATDGLTARPAAPLIRGGRHGLVDTFA